MNRRELLQLGAGCLGGLPLLAYAAPNTWRLRVVAVRHEPAAGLEAPALATELQARGALRCGAPVRVHNGTDRTLELRSAGWDRDLSLAPGAHGECRLAGSGSAAFSAAAGALHVRGLLGHGVTSAGAVDAEYALPIHHWSPPGRDIVCATLGGRVLAASEPLRVRAGQRVRFTFFNASERRAVSLHLPGHDFEVQAFDDIPLPRAVRVSHLELAPGERVDAQVTMDRPGRWVLGSLSRTAQAAGFGRMIEYAGAHGAPVAPSPTPVRFSHAQCATPDPSRGAGTAAQEIVLDGTAWRRRTLGVEAGEHRRLEFSNLSPTLQVVAVRGHHLELRQSGNVHVRALHKDTLALPPFARVAVQLASRAPDPELLRL